MKNKKTNLQLFFSFFIIFLFTVGSEVIQSRNLIIFFKIVFIIYVLFFIMFYYKRHNFDKFVTYLILFNFYQILISFFMHTLSLDALFSIISFSSLVIFFNIMLIKNCFETIKVFYYFFNFYFLISVFLFVLYKLDFLQSDLLLGGKNVLSLYFIPFIYFSSIYSLKKYNKISKLFIIKIVLSCFFVLFHRSGTGTVTILLSAIFLLIMNFNISSNKLKIFLVFTYVIMSFLIINSLYISNISFINNFIINTLHKDFTFNGRSYLWDYSIQFISSNLLGFGKNNLIIFNQFGKYYISACHNMFLEILLEGGIPLIILYFIIILNILKVKVNNNKLAIFSIGIVFCFFINGLTESIPYILQLWLILVSVKHLNNYYEGESYD